MTLNYRAVVERYAFPNGVVGSSNHVMKSFSYLTEKKPSQVARKPRAHPPRGRQRTPTCTKRILEQGRANKVKFTSDCPMLVIYLFIYL